MAFRGTWSPNFDCISRTGDQGIPLLNNTVAVWVKWDNLTNAYEAIEINIFAGSPFGAAIILAGTNWDFVQRNSAGGQVQVVSAATAAVWTHVAMTYDGAVGLTAYINGVNVGTAGIIAGARGNWGDLQVGPGAGEFQDACFYTVALTPEQIVQLYRNRLPGARTGLRHHLPCFPGTANRILDYSGNALNFANAPAPTDALTWPQAGWGTGSPKSLYSEASSTPKPAAADGDTLFGGAAAASKTLAAAAGGDTLFGGAAAAVVIKNAACGGETWFGGTAAATGGGAPPSGTANKVKNWRTPKRGR